MKKLLFLILILIPFFASAQITGEIKLGKEQLVFDKQDGYDRIISLHEFIREPGLPELTVVFRSFVIPPGATNVTLRPEITHSEKLAGSYRIYPVQPPQVNKTSVERSISNPDMPAYSLTDSFPGKTAEILTDGYCQGYRVVTIAVYPLLFIPGTGELYLNDISFSLDYVSGMPPADPGTIISVNRFNLAKAFVKSMVDNPADVEIYSADILKEPEVTDLNRLSAGGRPRSLNIRDTIIPDFVIITSEELKSSFQKLADWKIKKGIPTIIKTVEEIEADYTGSYLFDKIRNYLLDIQNRWGRNSLYILLGGDIEVIPSRKMKSESGEENNFQVSDLYYVMDKYTWTPQDPTDEPDYTRISSYMGRIPVSTPQEATIVVNKILNYEKAAMDINDYTYFNNFLIASGFKSPDGNSAGGMKLLNDNCKKYRNSTSKYWYMFDHFGCGHDYTVHGESMEYDSTFGEELNRSNFLSALQNGRSFGSSPEKFHFVYHDDHSYSTNMGTSAENKGQCITITDVDNIVDDPYCKIILSNGCHPANFSKECMAERFLKKNKGGAVAFIGNTDVGWVGHYFHFTQFMKSLFTEMQESPLQKSMGYLFMKAATREGGYKPNSHRFHLLGDPTMAVWTEKPKNLIVSVTPQSITSGVNEITVKIINLPVGQQALVCLMKGEEGYAVLTIKDRKEHRFSFEPRTSGVLDVTVTTHGFKPYETTIPVNASENPSVYISNLTFYDDRSNGSVGNADGQLDAGETIALNIELENSGKVAFNRIYGTLATTCPYIELLSNQAEFGGISAGSTTASTTPFRFRINKDAPQICKNDITPVRFTLKIENGFSDFFCSDTFRIEINAPELVLGSQNLQRLQLGKMGLTVELRNAGKATATGLMAVLSVDPQNSNVEGFFVSKSVYMPIAHLQAKNSATQFQFQTVNDYVSGGHLGLTLKVTNEYGRSWTFPFDPVAKCDKIFVSDIMVKTTGSNVELSWNKSLNASGYDIYRCDNGFLTTFTRLNTLPVPEPYFEDNTVQPKTTYYYKVAAIRNEGNQGLLSDPVKVVTSPPLSPGFPCSPRFRSEGGNLTVADIDNDGYKEIAFVSGFLKDTKQGFLTVMNHDGSELFHEGSHETYAGVGLLP